MCGELRISVSGEVSHLHQIQRRLRWLTVDMQPVVLDDDDSVLQMGKDVSGYDMVSVTEEVRRSYQVQWRHR